MYSNGEKYCFHYIENGKPVDYSTPDATEALGKLRSLQKAGLDRGTQLKAAIRRLKKEMKNDSH